MNVREELLDLKSLKGQTRRADISNNVCSAVDDMKLPWSKVSGITTDGAPATAGEQSGLSTFYVKKSMTKKATLFSFIASFISKSSVPNIYHLVMS